MKKLPIPTISNQTDMVNAITALYNAHNAVVDRLWQIQAAIKYQASHSPIDDNIRSAIKQAAPDDPDAH